MFLLSIIYGQTKQIGYPSVTNYSRYEYHAGTQNWAVGQDENGIMYFANNVGFLEFDGVNWQLFQLPNRTVVRSFAFAPDGKLYVGGQNEVGYLEADVTGNRRFTSVAGLIPADMQNFEDIWKIYVNTDTVTLFSEKAVFTITNEKVSAIEPNSKRFENIFKSNGRIYVQSQDQGLFVKNGDKLELISGGNIFSGSRIIGILPYVGSKSLIVTSERGMFIMDEHSIYKWDTRTNDLLINSQAYCSVILEDGTYALGTVQNGLLIIDQEGEVVLHLNKDKGLQNNTILSIFQDAQMNLWLGLDNGIDYVEINSPFSIIGTESGVEGTGYTSLVYDNTLYLGTNQGLFRTKWSDERQNGQPLSFNKVPNTVGQVWNLDVLGKSILVNQHYGAFLLEQNSIKKFSSTKGSWKFLELENYPGYALEGTYSGLWLYKNENTSQTSQSVPRWRVVKKLEGFDESARVFEEDMDGNIWVSHVYIGLYKIELTEDPGKISDIKLYLGENGLPDGYQIHVVKVRNEIIFTTPNGVYQYDKAADEFFPHEEFTTLLGENKNVRRILEDESGNVWFSVSSDFGLLNVKEQGVYNKLEMTYFNQIQDDLVNGFEHVYALDDHNVFIGSENGFVHYDPSREINTGFPFGIVIRKVISTTAGDSVIFDNNSASFREDAQMNLTHRMNDLRMSFSMPYYEKINRVQYCYLLEGFEDDWSMWALKTDKEYTNLPAGEYNFKVKARNAYGEISDEAIFSFKISPPWYASLLARIIYFIVVLTFLFLLYQFASRKEKKKAEIYKKEQSIKLEQKEAEYKKEVERSETETMNLRNEKLRESINHKNSQLASTTMHLVQKSEILMKLKSDLKNLMKDAPDSIKGNIRQIGRTIDADIQLDDNWKQFEVFFDQVHGNFFQRLRERFPELTPKDQKLCAYLRMNLTTKEIAPLLNISVRGVEISRYRLRKKLDLNTDTNLVSYIMDI